MNQISHPRSYANFFTCESRSPSSQREFGKLFPKLLVLFIRTIGTWFSTIWIKKANGKTTSEVPITITKSACLTIYGASSKDLGNDYPKKITSGLTNPSHYKHFKTFYY